MSATETDNGETVPAGYTETNRKAYGSQQEVADAWDEMLWPSHNVTHGYSLPSSRPGDAEKGAELYSSDNFRGYQFPDGSGVLMHYSTREAIRTADGLVISNQQCWSGGFAHCSTPEEYDVRLPLSAIERVLNDENTVFDITAVHGQPQTVEYDYSDGTHTVRRARETVVEIDGEGGRHGVYVGRDASATGSERHYVMALSESELDRYADDPEAVTELLVPDPVQASDLPVVTSTEFARSRLEGEELEAHVEAGGKVRESESRYRDYKINTQQFRADLQGEVIVRQGEWFFIPTDEEPAENGTHDAAEALGNHRAQRFHGARAPIPTECGACGASKLEMDDDGDVTCRECGRDVPRPVYVRGQIRHTNGDHNAINLGETWHRAVTHDRDVMMYDDSPGGGRRRSSRTGRWD